ncbi:SMC-Scp complex subunit ScpB [Novacetimonas pomaceti]|uniref:SMC-Scp complex subunit ScpB n=1 Tax=Novacetimonas pomaceti TaxID=2021998 RepID=A0ABX5P678_9PROT|nr:SMC-Scp complex subunit ScpB [Novacetimonas pomaceti]PYD48936.1 SMC-Scp complex subunit ScpB [Novacetimonas pomaceti]
MAETPEDIVVSEMSLRLVEALIFARAEPVSERAIAELLETQGDIPAGVQDLAAYTRATLDALLALYEGRGVMPVQVAGGWQFRTTPDLAPRLTRVLRRPRRLARSTMETLAIIAYHQPCTRAEIEGIRGVSLSQQVLDTLLEAELVVPLGRKEVPGRPILWGTSEGFLRHFGLRDLRDLPRREELLVDVPDLAQAATPDAAEGGSGADAPDPSGMDEDVPAGAAGGDGRMGDAAAGPDDVVCAPPDA